jgi:DNA-binding Xre family transcriptional regulator
MNLRFFCSNCKKEAVFGIRLINKVLAHHCICEECGKEIILQEKTVGWNDLSEEAVFFKDSISELWRRGKKKIKIKLIKTLCKSGFDFGDIVKPAVLGNQGN